jgi:hypothetical protein
MSQKKTSVNEQIPFICILQNSIISKHDNIDSHFNSLILTFLNSTFVIGPHALKGILQIILDSDFEIETYSVISL